MFVNEQNYQKSMEQSLTESVFWQNVIILDRLTTLMLILSIFAVVQVAAIAVI